MTVLFFLYAEPVLWMCIIICLICLIFCVCVCARSQAYQRCRFSWPSRLHTHTHHPIYMKQGVPLLSRKTNRPRPTCLCVVWFAPCRAALSVVLFARVCVCVFTCMCARAAWTAPVYSRKTRSEYDVAFAFKMFDLKCNGFANVTLCSIGVYFVSHANARVSMMELDVSPTFPWVGRSSAWVRRVIYPWWSSPVMDISIAI